MSEAMRWEREVEADALRQAAVFIEEFAADFYPEDIFRKPTPEDFAAINALLKRERGHQLDGVAGECYRRALALAAHLLRERAVEVEELVP